MKTLLLMLSLCALGDVFALMKVTGGSVVALVTPMTRSNNVDIKKLTDLLEWHVEQGTAGAVILGTTGEANTITLPEREEIIKAAVASVGGKMPIIVGTGTIDPNVVIRDTQQAKDLGADASLIITPYYVKPPQRALAKHFLSIADTVDLPMILYNCPGRTGVDMKPETVKMISDHKNVIGIKEATGDLSRVKLIKELCGQDFLIYSGEDDQGCEHCSLGGDGVISVTANCAPAMMTKMLAASREGNSKTANEMNDDLILLHKALFFESNPIPAKKAMELMGKIDNGIRPPLTELADEYLPGLKEALIKNDCI